MVLNKKTISSGIWSFIIFFVLTEPVFFQHIWTKRLYQIVTFFVFALVAVFFFQMQSLFREAEVRKFSKIPLLVIFYYGYLTVVTLFSGGALFGIFFRGIQFCAIAMYFDIVMKNNPKAIFTTWLNILTFYVVANCLTVFIFPNGMYRDDYFNNNFLLGYDNQNINFILPAMIIVLLKHLYYKPCKWQVFFTYLISAVTIIKVWSGASLVIIGGMTLFACFFIFRGGFGKRVVSGRIFNMGNYIIVNIVAAVLLVFMNIQYYLDFFIVNILHKSLTLTGRTLLWQRVMEFVGRNPIFGYGYEQATERAVKMGFPPYSPYGLHSHNRFLETVYSGGLILFAAYMYILFYVSKCLKPIENTSFAKILSFGIFIYMIGMLTEVYPYSPFFFALMVIAENGRSFVKSVNEQADHINAAKRTACSRITAVG